ncbi:hypothetical protein [Streptomyces mirabilis]|uniref:hypothetical protein n=1 Tax=Streptomyces mirabilis TaxID=68239 RepID=UPI00371698C4
MNIRYAALAATAICALSAAGCGIADDTDPVVPAVAIDALPPVLVGEDSGSVTLIETTTRYGNITGTMDTTEFSDDGPQRQSASLTGIVTGDQVVLSANFPTGTTIFTGTLFGTTLTPQVPQQNGQIENYVLRPGTAADYDQRSA